MVPFENVIVPFTFFEVTPAASANVDSSKAVISGFNSC